ncbi:PREDICTED: docking protein 3-like [Priapulus caudatus]|uniref:Docking protein 3-like n=1 Tax=Priapulus caudatus TaxID=37621 RepID=A0ABM1F167_PRICU|nr:PREDICTED: docking protein 3-like [Priapulus caudatus]XP_014678188.1 PREDICTED: docking protein 3-like [Priapulus caudatus]XP_014678189.1 PREDICTED: docking protein 3-like [Priapulus caudatus]
MSMIADELPVKSGFLYSPQHRITGILKRTWMKRYYGLFVASDHGRPRLEYSDSEDQFYGSPTTRKLIPLADCVKVVEVPHKTQEFVFEIATGAKVHQFSTENMRELRSWLPRLQKVLFGSSWYSTDYSDDFDQGDDDSDSLEFISKDLFSDTCTSQRSYAVDEFMVEMLNSEASKRCGLHGTYLLQVLSDRVTMRRPFKCDVILVWPYKLIRKYGKLKGSFNFEAGRRCESGQGVFAFATDHGQEESIFNLLRTKSRMSNLQESNLGVNQAELPPLSQSTLISAREPRILGAKVMPDYDDVDKIPVGSKGYQACELIVSGMSPTMMSHTEMSHTGTSHAESGDDSHIYDEPDESPPGLIKHFEEGSNDQYAYTIDRLDGPADAWKHQGRDDSCNDRVVLNGDRPSVPESRVKQIARVLSQQVAATAESNAQRARQQQDAGSHPNRCVTTSGPCVNGKPLPPMKPPKKTESLLRRMALQQEQLRDYDSLDLHQERAPLAQKRDEVDEYDRLDILERAPLAATCASENVYERLKMAQPTLGEYRDPADAVVR